MRKIYLEYNLSQRATTATLGIGTTTCMWLEVFDNKSRSKKTISATMALTSYGAKMLMTKIRIRKKEKKWMDCVCQNTSDHTNGVPIPRTVT